MRERTAPEIAAGLTRNSSAQLARRQPARVAREQCHEDAGRHARHAGLDQRRGEALDEAPDPVTAHRRVAYVAGESLLWPSMTLEFLARVHGGTDVAYRDALVERFRLDTRKKIRALSKGNRQKVQLIAAFATRAPCSRRPHGSST
jgi:hypothetical protein